MTLQELYRQFTRELSGIYDASEASAISNIIFEKIAGIDKKSLVQNPGLDISNAIETKLFNVLNELMQHKPVQYITGEAWFYNLLFKVNEHVLIPRPETEELVKLLLDNLQLQSSKKILDIGTGSGCIPVTIKKNAPANDVTAIDISSAALDLAKENTQSHQIEINWICMDFLAEDNWEQLGNYDIIISNPPYIPAKEKWSMDKNVVEYEPALALFVADEQPLIFYEKIAAFAEMHLNTGGKIFLETHKNLANEVAALFNNKNYEVQSRKDISGNDRMIEITRYR